MILDYLRSILEDGNSLIITTSSECGKRNEVSVLEIVMISTIKKRGNEFSKALVSLITPAKKSNFTFVRPHIFLSKPADFLTWFNTAS